MAPATADANFSELIQKPKDTVARMQHSPRQGILLHRRDDEDLYLTTAERVSQATEVVNSTTRMFVALMKEDANAATLLTRIFPEAFPWVRFLPQHAVQEFLVEFVDTARASTDLGRLDPIAVLIANWRNTAEVYADPRLHEALTADHGDEDFGPVPEPEVPHE